MELNRFGHLLVQELFQKGYFTSVFKAYDESQNKGVLLQIITPIFSSNKRYNQLLADYAHKMVSHQTYCLLPISNVLTDSDRVGVVYDLPTGLSSEWGTFSSLDTQTTAEVINTCQKSMVMSFSWLEENNILHRALRPDSIAFHEASNQAFLTLSGLFEALFYLETEQNPAYQGQFQANFYKPERIGVFKNYDINDEYYSFAKTWYYLDMIKNQIPVKTIESNLQALSVSSENPMAEQLNVFLGGDLLAKQQIFATHFQETITQTAEKLVEQEQPISTESIAIETPTVLEEDSQVELPPFQQTTVKQNEGSLEENDSNDEDKKLVLFPWKKYGLITGLAAVILILVSIIYTNLTVKESVSSQQTLGANQPKEDELLRKDSIQSEQKNPTTPKKNIPTKDLEEIKTNPTTSSTSALASIDNSYGIFQLDALSNLIDISQTLSKGDRKLLNAKANEIYTNLPQMASQLTSSDQRKLCNYRSKFENHLRRNGFSISGSIAKNLEVHCN
jgi:serine/threonine protein kinase